MKLQPDMLEDIFAQNKILPFSAVCDINVWTGNRFLYRKQWKQHRSHIVSLSPGEWLADKMPWALHPVCVCVCASDRSGMANIFCPHVCSTISGWRVTAGRSQAEGLIRGRIRQHRRQSKYSNGGRAADCLHKRNEQRKHRWLAMAGAAATMVV